MLTLQCLLGAIATTSAADARGLSAPRLASPANGAQVQQLPAISWNAVRGAAAYEYEISADSHFSALVLGKGPGKGVSHTFNLAAALDKTVPNGTYYWRVRALTAKDKTGPWSRVRRIVKEWNIAPQITGGDGAAVNWPSTPLVMRWSSVPYANKYIVSVATDPALSNLVLGSAAKPVETQGIHLVMPISLAPGAYYWAVTPVDAEGRRGARSRVASFQWAWPTTTSTSLSDLNPEAGAFDDPMFFWNPIPGAARYEVEVNAAEGFPTGSKWCCAGTTTGTSLAPLQTLANNRYYWRVRALDARGDAGVWNYGQPFDKAFDPNTPTIPNLTLRATTGAELSGFQETDTPVVTWAPVPGASLYQVQWAPYKPLNREPPYTPECEWSIVSREPLRYQGQTASTAWTPLGAATGSNEHIGPPAWPHAQNSTVLHSEVAFEANTEAGSATLTHVTPGSGAAMGDLVRGPGIAAGTLVVEASGSEIRLSQNAIATAKGVELRATPRYCIRVAARSDEDARRAQVISDWTQINGAGQPAFAYTAQPESGPRESPFVTHAGAYILPSSATNTPRTPLFTWRPVAGAKGYYVVVARDSGFTQVVDVGFTNLSAYAPRLANRAPFSDETTAYYWAVIPSAGGDGSGVADDVPQDNSPHSFNKSSGPPQPLGPAPGAEISSQPTFRWTGAENARNYHLQVAQDPTFGKPIDDVTTDTTAFTSSSTYPADTVLYWRVRANDWIGQGLNWSRTQTFVRRLPVPLLEPRAPTTIFGPAPITWTPVQGAISYDLHIEQGTGKSEEFSSEVPSVTIAKYYGAGITHFQVRAEFPTNTSGKVPGAYTPLQSSLLILAAPTGARGIKSGSRLLVTWYPEPDAKQYQVEISTTNGFSTTIESHRLDGTSWAPNINLSRKQYRGTLYWRVAPVDQNGGVGSFASGSFGAPRPHASRCAAKGKRGKHTARCKKR